MSYIVLTTDITVENHKFHFKMNFKSQKNTEKKTINKWDCAASDSFFLSG